MTSQPSNSTSSSSSRADKYLIAEQIGKGSFGAANVVIHKETKKKYVLKRIRLARLSDWQRRSSFQELQLVSSLDHPFVVPFVEGWVDRGHTINIVYGYCRNGDLGTLLHSQKGHFSEDRLKTWLAQSLLGLEYIHKAGVLHRDIKSSNLFLTRDYDIQIGDFGLATIRDGKSGDPDYSVVGTPHYMAPELLSKQRYGFPADIWSLGCVMYELTALKPAFNAFNMHGLIHKIRKGSLPPMPSQYSSQWRSLIKNMLKKVPKNRPTLSDLINAPCMREAMFKAFKRAKHINKHFVYTDLLDEVPDYWKPQFSMCRTEREDSETPLDEGPSSEFHRRAQKPVQSDDASCHESEGRNDSEPPRPSQSPSTTNKTETEGSISDRPTSSQTHAAKPQTIEESEACYDKDEPNADEDDEDTGIAKDDESESGRESAEQSERPVSSDEGSKETPDAIAECSEAASSPQDEDSEKDNLIKQERGLNSSDIEGKLPYRLDRVDVKKLVTEAESAEYHPNHWCNPSHMSAFFDGGKKGDGLHVIQEDTCEEPDFWQSLPMPNADYNVQSPRRNDCQDYPNGAEGQNFHSFWGDSPSQLDPRCSSTWAGSFGVENAKKTENLEQILALCASLYNRGRWQELGHILTQTSRQCYTPGGDTPEPAKPTVRLNLNTGDRVNIGTAKSSRAIVRYYGPVVFGAGDWIGLELESASGNTDGTVNGISYFSCPKDCGMFIKASMFDKIDI